MKNIFNYFLVPLLLLCGQSSHSQEEITYLEPRCFLNNPDGTMSQTPCREGYGVEYDEGEFDIVWKKNGTVVVLEDVTFISGIKKYKTDKVNNPIYDYEMLLVAPEDYHSPIKKTVYKDNTPSTDGYYEVQVDISPDKELIKDAINSHGIVTFQPLNSSYSKLELFRRSDTEEDGFYNNEVFNFSFNLSSSNKSLADLVYGAESTYNSGSNSQFELQNTPFDAWEYFHYPTSGTTTALQSTDYFQNWSKPRSQTWKDTAEFVILAASVALTFGVALEVLLPELALQYGAAGLYASESIAASKVARVSYAFGRTQYKIGSDVVSRLVATNARYNLRSRIVRSFYFMGTAKTASHMYFNSGSLDGLDNNSLALKDRNYIFIPDEQPLPPDATEAQRSIEKIYNGYRNFSVPCPTYLNLPAGSQCHRNGLEPVVVKLRAKDNQISQLLLPGTLKDIVTPYNLFKENMWNYTSPDLLVGKTVVAQNAMRISRPKDVSTIVNTVEPGTVLRDVIEGDGNFDLKLDLEEDKEPSFYVYSHSKPNFGNQKIISRQLGDLGNHTNTSKTLTLYKCTVIGNLVDDTVNITLDSDGTNPLYLTGDNIIIKNYEESGLLFVGQDTRNLFNSTALKYEDSDGNIIPTSNRPETHAVVSNAVSILDDDFVKPDAVVQATNKFGLYVGAVGEAESGILTNNAALLEVNIPDFVFEDQYNLSSLMELETFVKANKHLPYVPNQQDYKADGYYSAGQMMMGQLQNLEELYLHTFSQEEQIIALDKDTKAIDKDLQHLEQIINQLKKQ